MDYPCKNPYKSKSNPRGNLFAAVFKEIGKDSVAQIHCP